VNTVSLFLGNIPVYTFSLIIGIGTAVGLFWSTYRILILPEAARERFTIGTIALTGALVGGRTAFIYINWIYFQQHVIEIPQIWLGGISWVGAMSGSLLFLIIAAFFLNRPISILLDGQLPLLASITTSVWLACWITGYAYGIETTAWYGVPSRDEWGQVSIRWPTQIAGAVSTLGIHWIVEQFRFRRWLLVPGLAASVEIAGLSLTILALSAYRADPTPIWNGIRIDVTASLALFTLSTIAAVIFYKLAQIANPIILPIENHED